MARNIKTTQKTKDNPENKIIIPLLEKPNFKGELMDFYYAEKMERDTRSPRDHLIKEILDDFLKKGIIEIIENYPSNHKGKVYYDINWTNLLSFYLQHNSDLFDKQDKIILNQKEIDFLVNFCKKNRGIIFGENIKFKDILINQSVWGNITFSFYILYLSQIRNFQKNRHLKDILGDVINQTMTSEFNEETTTNIVDTGEPGHYFPYKKINDIDYEETVMNAIKNISSKIRRSNKKDKENFRKFKKLFLKIYPDSRIKGKKESLNLLIEDLLPSERSVTRAFK